MKIRKSIDHFTGKEQNALFHIRKEVIETLKPELLFLLSCQVFTSLRRDYLRKEKRSAEFHFSCDLLAILPDQSPLLQDDAIVPELENSLLPVGKVDVEVYSMDRFVQELQSKTFFLPTIYRHAILLFEREKGCFQKVISVTNPEQDHGSKAKGGGATEGNQEAHQSNASFVEGRHPLLSHVFYPHCLTKEEQSNPFIVLFNFFEMMDLKAAKAEIQLWVDSVNTPRQWKKHEAVNQLAFYEVTNKLIEAAWIISTMDFSGLPANISAMPEPEVDLLLRTELYCPEAVQDAWGLFPRSLSKEQFINPYLVFKDFFVFWSLNEWKEELHNLLHLSFADAVLEDCGETVDLMNIKLQLDRLVEACHLIRVRESKREGD